ncbi:MAG: hypothetical protein JWQ40_629 [Segetibacter sp.]|nr:hypothetical protein [Segetibacter sp.]
MLFYVQKIGAQGINGDTIFVNADEERQIKFPSNNIDPPKWTNTAVAPPYGISKAPGSVFIHATEENAKCANLLVSEGGSALRFHKFVICYKKNINSEPIDYSTIEKIKKRIKEIEGQEALKKVAATETPKPAIATSSNPPVAQPEYSTKLKEGDEAIKIGRWDVAQGKYEEVLRAQPNNPEAKRGLSEVKDKKAKKELDEKTNGIRTAADNAFNAKQYEEAAGKYKQVLELKHDDLYSNNQLALIQKIKAESLLLANQEKEKAAHREQEEKINGVKERAGKAFNEKRYDDAISEYNQVLAANPNDVLAKGRIETIQKLKEQEVLARKQEKENNDREENFKTYIKSGDKAFENQEFDVARAAYLEAKGIKTNDPELEKKIKITNDKILSKESEEEYKTALDLGDEAQKAGDFERAKAELTKASKMFPQRTFPLERIKEINKIVDDLAKQKIAEKEKEAKEFQNNTNYFSTVAKADKAFEINDYVNAKTYYSIAASLKPTESYPKDKLTEVQVLLENTAKAKKAKADSAAAAAEINTKYIAALKKGSSALTKKDYAIAKIGYLEAAEFKPAEQEPKIKLEFIEKQLAGIDVNAKYDSAMAKGNLALGDKNYPLALQFYREAQNAKPLEGSILNNINYVRGLIASDSTQQANAQRQAEIKVQEEVIKKRFDQGMYAYTQYEIAAQTANFEEQLIYLKQFLNTIPDNTILDQHRFDAGAKIVFAKKKIQTIREYLARTKGSSYQVEEIPYLDQELEKKYEAINFTAAPDGQGYSATDSADYNENIKLSKELLATNARLDLLDSSNNVKLGCQSISFKGEKAFFKFVVQNNDTEEFLTGAMLLSLIKKNGATTKIYPRYVYPFPIILPGKGFSILYVAKDQEVKDDDKLSFELNDRLKKKKLTISIPGNIYNQEKKAKLAM